MLHSSSSFRKKVIQNFQQLPKPILYFCGNGVSEVPRRPCQRCMGLDVVHEVVEIARQRIKCMSTCLAKSLNTVKGSLIMKEFVSSHRLRQYQNAYVDVPRRKKIKSRVGYG